MLRLDPRYWWTNIGLASVNIDISVPGLVKHVGNLVGSSREMIDEFSAVIKNISKLSKVQHSRLWNTRW